METASSITNRSYLFAPGSTRRVLEKALDAGADAVILDLEDAVRPEEKARARDVVAEVVRRRGSTAIPEVFVRINVLEGEWGEEDLSAVCHPGLSGVVLPKAESSAQVQAAGRRIDDEEIRAGVSPGTIALVPLVETAVGVLRSVEIASAHPRVATLTLGAVDLLADLGARGGTDGPATSYARAHLVLACRAAGVAPPIDTVFTALDDDRGLTRASTEARDLGYFGKLVLHPRQLPVVHDVFTPTDADVGEARRFVRAFQMASRDGLGAVALDGEFVDLPVFTRAERTLALAERLGRRTGAKSPSRAGDAGPRAEPVGTLRGLVIDVDDLARGEVFWSTVTGLPVRWSARGPFSLLGELTGPKRLLLQLVDDLSAHRNRVHLDVTVTNVDAAVARVIDLGGRRVHATRSKVVGRSALRWAVVADPFDNVFCLVQDEDL